jgi:hypothetical protein
LLLSEWIVANDVAPSALPHAVHLELRLAELVRRGVHVLEVNPAFVLAHEREDAASKNHRDDAEAWDTNPKREGDENGHKAHPLEGGAAFVARIFCRCHIRRALRFRGVRDPDQARSACA